MDLTIGLTLGNQNKADIQITEEYLRQSIKSLGFNLVKIDNNPQPEPQPEPKPIPPDINEDAGKLLSYLKNLDGILTGQESMYWSTDFNDGKLISNYDKQIYQITGKYPALYSSDFGDFGKDVLEDRKKVVDVVKSNHARGSIIQLHYHMVQPDEPDGSGFNTMHKFTKDNPYPSEKIDAILNPGSLLNLEHLNRLDEIAGYLKQLKDDGIAVLWRPYHEMNGHWFWWGCQPRFKELWVQMYEYFTITHGLDNLLWVFSSNYWEESWTQQDPSNFYPGHDYVDVLGVDIYTDYSHKYSKHIYDRLLEIGQGKPIAITENGEMPNISEIKKTQPKWCYYSTWWGFHTAKNGNTDTLYKSNYDDPFAITLKEEEKKPVDSKLIVHCIGDSITENPGWRSIIYSDLLDSGTMIDFVGSTKDKYPKFPDPDHDGHGGWTTHQVLKEIDNWYKNMLSPEVTIIMIGTNDIAWWIAESVTKVADRLDAIIAKAILNSPKSTLLVASIPPQSSKVVEVVRVDRAKLTRDYNKEIASLVAKRRLKDKKIFFIDVFSALTTTDLRDGIHPNDAGNVKIGKLFSKKIKEII